MNITVDDLSPVIDYQPAGAWSQHNSDNDLTAASYFQSTFSRTRRIGANATISFSGTSIAILGAQNGDNGTHTVFVDGKQVAAGPTLGETIFSTSNLSSGWHTITVTNGEDTTGLTIDQVIWSSQAAAAVPSYIDDGDPAFQYNPAKSWSTGSSDFKVFRNGTGHRTVTQGASVQYTFEGDSISVYGSVGPNYGAYGVSVDQQAGQTYVAQKQVTGRALLFFTDGLGQGNHTVTFTNQDSRLFDVDYAVIGRLSSATPTPTPESTARLGHKGIPTGALVGIIFGTIIVIALSILALVYRWVNKKLIKKIEDDQMAPNQFDTLGTANTIHGPDVVGLYPPSAREKLAILDAGAEEEPGQGSANSSAARKRSVDSSADTLVAEDKFRYGSRPNQQDLASLPYNNGISATPGTYEEPPPVTTPASAMTALPRYSQMTQRPGFASNCVETPQVVSPTATPTTPFNWAGASWYPKVPGVSEEESVLASTYHSPEEGSVLRSASRYDYGSSGLDGESGHS